MLARVLYEALRAALVRPLDRERERAIESAYCSGYAEHPQDEWVGQVGLAGLEELDRTERGKPI